MVLYIFQKIVIKILCVLKMFLVDISIEQGFLNFFGRAPLTKLITFCAPPPPSFFVKFINENI